MNAKLIQAKIDEIIVRDRLRKVLPDRVATLAEDFRINGQMVPIDLVETDEGMRLVFGAHRIAARRATGNQHVMALLHPKGTFGSEFDLLKREIAENFQRFELTVIERAATVAAMREVHEAEHGPILRGPKKKLTGDPALEEISASFVTNFTEVVQRTLQLSRRDVFRALKIASIAPELCDQLAALPIADNQSELLQLAAETPARQARIVGMLVAGMASVAEAIAFIDDVPPPVAQRPFERLSDSFSRLKPAEQTRFFDLHAEDIERWLASRQNRGGQLK